MLRRAPALVPACSGVFQERIDRESAAQYSIRVPACSGELNMLAETRHHG